MLTYTFKQFADQIDAIEALLQIDAAFREICYDFEEANSLFSEHCQSSDSPSNMCVRWLELISELEGEIIEALEEAGH